METSETTLRITPRRRAVSTLNPPPPDQALKAWAKDLTVRQQRYCLEYLVDFNQTQAAIRAGFAKRSAAKQAAELMTHPVVSEYLRHAVSAKLQKLDSDSNRLMLELSRLAHVNTKHAFRPDGSFLPLHEMPDDVARCIAGIETEEEYETRYEHHANESEPVEVLVRTVIRKIKFWDKNKAADTLAKCLKLFSNDVNVNVNVSLESLVMTSIAGADKKLEQKPAALEGSAVAIDETRATALERADAQQPGPAALEQQPAQNDRTPADGGRLKSSADQA